MKTIYKYLLVPAFALALTSCEDWMDAQPEGGTKTEAQKQDAASQNPEAAAADVSAMYAVMIDYQVGLGDLGYERHNDFGYPAIRMFCDAMGQDFIGDNIGYNWFSNSDYTTNRDNTLTTTYGLASHLLFNTYYKIIHAANNVIASASRENPGGMKYGLSQALVVRAAMYLELAQLYATPYDKGTDAKCVPLVVDNMPAEKQTVNPRATLKEIYDMIEADLNYACDSLAGYRGDKGSVTQGAAYGVRARMNLVMGKGAEAAADAQKALEVSGAKPLSIAQAGVPGFCKSSAPNVIWANVITENNDVVQTAICNWTSHMCSFYTDGYTGVGAYRKIGSALYNQISDTDIRKTWWLNEELASPMIAGSYADWKATAESDPSMAYVNVKFGTADGSLSGTAGAAADWIVMRAEEMYLIWAEGLAIAGDASAATVLQNFVQTYRDPAYTVSGNVRDAVWMQRRIELWGEGFELFDIMRLHKPITRTANTNWPAAWNQDIPADHGCLQMRIPQAEIEANGGLTNDDAPYYPFSMPSKDND